MTKRIKIPGRFESAETGNVVAGADAILDDVKGKKQSVINSEVDAELVRLDQEKQNNLTFDNAPTEESNNPVKSGGVYAADKALSDAIEAILLLIPSAASALNQLADKNFVNSSISTATATPRGTYNLVSDLDLTTDATREDIAEKLGEVIEVADLNDYAFVQVPVSDDDPTEIESTERYKFNGNVWIYEYTLNTSGFTAAQWDAINSGITTALVEKLNGLPAGEALELALGAITQNIQNISAVIPTEATAQNQLADKAYVLTQILLATPSFKGQFTTLTQLEEVEDPKDGDLGIVRTKDSAGYDVFTFYQYLNNQWNEYYVMSYHPQDKPATTGWLGDYPYNGMGRIELPMNMVDGWPDNTWIYLPKNDVVYLLYSWHLQLYAVYNLTTQEGLGLDDNLVIKPENYDIADLEEIVNGHYLPFTEDGGVWIITKPDESTITSTELNNTNIYHFNDPTHHGINVLTQAMMTRTNTVYVIQHDFDLNGATITVPANCVLEFDGGSMSNGTLVGQNTCIDAKLIKIFGKDLLFLGSWKVTEVFPEWFGVENIGLTDQTQNIQKAVDFVNSFKIGRLKFSRGIYRITSINMTQMTGVTIEGAGMNFSSIQGISNDNTRFIVFGSNSVGFDLSDAKGVVLKDFSVEGSTETTPYPKCLILMTRSYKSENVYDHTNKNLIENVEFLGRVEYYGLLVNNSEINDFYRLCFSMYAGKACLGILSENTIVLSPFVTTIQTGVSATINNFSNCSIIQYCVTGDDIEGRINSCVHLVNGHMNISFRNSYIRPCSTLENVPSHAFVLETPNNNVEGGLTIEDVRQEGYWGNKMSGSFFKIIDNYDVIVMNICIRNVFTNTDPSLNQLECNCRECRNFIIENVYSMPNTSVKYQSASLNNSFIKLAYAQDLAMITGSYIASTILFGNANIYSYAEYVSSGSILLGYDGSVYDGAIYYNKTNSFYSFNYGKNFKLPIKTDNPTQGLICMDFENLFYNAGEYAGGYRLIQTNQEVSVLPENVPNNHKGKMLFYYNNDRPCWYTGNTNKGKNGWVDANGFTPSKNVGTYSEAFHLSEYGVLNPVTDKGYPFFATDKGAEGKGAMIYYTGDSTVKWVYADGTAVSW